MLGEDDQIPEEVKSKLNELNGHFFAFERANKPPMPGVLLVKVSSLCQALEHKGYYPSFNGTGKGYCLKKEKSLLDPLAPFKKPDILYSRKLDPDAPAFVPGSKM